MVGVKVYGRRPSMLRVMRNIMRDVRMVAHLCPLRFIGRRSC